MAKKRKQHRVGGRAGRGGSIMQNRDGPTRGAIIQSGATGQAAAQEAAAVAQEAEQAAALASAAEQADAAGFVDPRNLGNINLAGNAFGIDLRNIDFTKIPGHPSYIDPNTATADTADAGDTDDAGSAGFGTDTTDSVVQSVVDFANSGASNLEIANFIQSSGADLAAVAAAMGVDLDTATRMFTALTNPTTASVVEYQEANPDATETEVARFIRDTGADVTSVADALDIDQAVAIKAYEDALGSELETAKVTATPVTGITTTTPGFYRPPTVAVEDYVRQPSVSMIDVEDTGVITADNAIEQLEDYVNIEAPADVTSSEIEAAVGVVTDAIKSGAVAAQDYEAALVAQLNSTSPAVGTQRPPITVDEIRQLSQRAQAATMGDTSVGLARPAEFTINPDSFIPGVTAADVNVTSSPEIEKQQREAVLGESSSGVAAQILESVNYEAAQSRAIKGTAAKGAAASMVAEVGNIPSEVTAAIVENPVAVAEVIDSQPVELQAAVAALPEEALVSSQLETLLGGLEDGQIPTWARPAVDLVESQLQQRGMSVSTVGRDALFNAIIQSAIPIAQANATALQQRSSQNLSNEQQAVLQQQNSEMQLRMQNLANRQSAASQTAQMAQNMAQLQSQFKQDAAMLTAQQAQQIRTQNLANRQRSAEINAQNQQATNSLNLSNDQQMELANLEVMNLTERENMTAENQARLAEFQVAADFLGKNAAFKQQMEIANLDANQQVRLANLTALNNASSDNLSAAQQTELANLNARMETNLAQAQIAQSMGIAQLNADQQRAVENAKMVANIDLTKFNADQQVQLANSQFMQTVTITDFNARQQAAMQNATALASLDLSTVDQRTRVAIENANNFLQMDLANLSNEQQALILDQQMAQQTMLSNQAADNAAKQFKATSQQQADQFNANLASQMEQHNSTQANAMAQFNATEKNRLAALEAANEIEVAKFNNQLNVQLEQFNEQMDQQRDMWNAQNAQAIEQSNTEWRRQANTINTAAENAANATAAQQAYGISSQELANAWQQLRDDASYARTAYENEEQRKTTLYATALANDPGEAGDAGYVDKIVGIADRIIGT